MTYTDTDYQRERAIVDRAAAYWRANATYAKNGWSSLDPAKAAHPDYAACNNAMRGRVNRFELLRDSPKRITAYLSCDGRAITTWNGDKLGTAQLGRPYRSNMGDTRIPIRVRIGGADYAGTNYGGHGAYCQLRKLKTRTTEKGA